MSHRSEENEKRISRVTAVEEALGNAPLTHPQMAGGRPCSLSLLEKSCKL